MAYIRWRYTVCTLAACKASLSIILMMFWHCMVWKSRLIGLLAIDIWTAVCVDFVSDHLLASGQCIYTYTVVVSKLPVHLRRWTGSSQQPHSHIALPVSVTRLQWPRLPGPRFFPPNWVSMRPYCWLRLTTLTCQPHWSRRCSYRVTAIGPVAATPVNRLR